MSPETPLRELDLEAGELAFGDATMRIRTLLGSCVAITFWHPGRKVGAMCHYIVPERPAGEDGPPSGKYADDAIPAIAEHFRQMGLQPRAFEVKMFGGGNMFPGLPIGGKGHVGERNAQAGRCILEREGFRVLQEDLAGVERRVVIFDLGSGEVWVRQGDSGANVSAKVQSQDRRQR